MGILKTSSNGFSINTLSLLAMVLAIGLVVDDANVVVENVHRHIEEGKGRLEAALIGARELGLPALGNDVTGVLPGVGAVHGMSPRVDGVGRGPG